jgi:cysteinyl-tRNA synthetase
MSISEDVLALVKHREAARAEKRWKDADRLRDEIYDRGFDVEDTAKGPQLKPSKH